MVNTVHWPRLRGNSWLSRVFFLIQIDVALGGRQVGIFLGLAQQFVEFRIQNLAARFLGFELFTKDFIAAACFTFQLGDGGSEILDGRMFFGDFVGILRTAWQQGHSMSNSPLAIAPS